jgi:hypothetical protein
MSEREQLQKDILQELITYSDSLIPALQTMIDELRGGEREDTSDFLNDVINGINWEIEVYNQCASLINEYSNYIDKKAMIRAVQRLGIALNSEDKLMVADVLESDFLPFLNKLDLAAKKVME